MAAVLFGVLHLMPAWGEGTMLWRLLRLMAVVVIGAGSYFATLALLGFRPRDFARRTV